VFQTFPIKSICWEDFQSVAYARDHITFDFVPVNIRLWIKGNR